jgi:hypothetical protein
VGRGSFPSPLCHPPPPREVIDRGAKDDARPEAVREDHHRPADPA